jgi:hypothetical protein
LVGQSEPQTRGGTDERSVDGAGSGGVEVEPESEVEPLLTYARRNTGALSTDSPLDQHSGVASPQVPIDDSLDNNAYPDSGNNHESESKERLRGRGSGGGRGRRGSGVP